MRLLPVFYFRVSGRPLVLYAQDYGTAFMIRRCIHTFNVAFNLWLAPGKANGWGPESIARDGCEVTKLTWRQYRKCVGPRAWLELAEDYLHVSFHGIARWLIRHVSSLKRVGWIVRLSRDDQDYTEWDQHMERPHFELSGSPQ